jgi:hypothetical protein
MIEGCRNHGHPVILQIAVQTVRGGNAEPPSARSDDREGHGRFGRDGYTGANERVVTVEAIEPTSLHLASLVYDLPALTPALGGTLAEAAAVCLADRGHGDVCEMQLRWRADARLFAIHRPLVTDPMRRAYRDMQDATELGACGVAILAVRAITGYAVVERSVKGTGFDYWLGTIDAPSTASEPLERKARLEVSGILHGAVRSVEARVREKIRQTRRWAGSYPAYIVVVEFSKPMVRIERDE